MSLKECKMMIAQRILNTLRQLHAGITPSLNMKATSRYGVKFSELLIENPVEALKLLRETFPSTTPSALRSVLRSILRSVIADPVRLEYIVSELFRGNPEPFHEALREACRHYGR